MTWTSLQAQQQAATGRPRFRLTRADVWYGLRGLLRLSHAAAMEAMLREVPSLADSILAGATCAERRSFVAVECLHEVYATLGPQVSFPLFHSVCINIVPMGASSAEQRSFVTLCGFMKSLQRLDHKSFLGSLHVLI